MLSIPSKDPYALYVGCDAGMDYTSHNPGGIGIFIEFPDTVDLEPIEIKSGQYVDANIERLELEAIIKGMDEVINLFGKYPDKLESITMIYIMTDRFSLSDDERTNPNRIKEWRKRGWETYDGKPIKNASLLDKLDKMRKKLNVVTHCRIAIKYIPRKFNKTADKLAKQGGRKSYLKGRRV